VLAFTGDDAFRLAVLGAALLAAGLLLRRRSRTTLAAVAVPQASAVPEVLEPPADASPRNAGAARVATAVVGAVVLGALMRRGRP
jgi:hypothetical protein